MHSPSEDKEWATKYLLNPLTDPEPSEETGPGTHFRNLSSSSQDPATTSYSTSDRYSKHPTATDYPTPPTSSSPTRTTFHPSNPYSSSSHRKSAFSDYSQPGTSRRSFDQPATQPATQHKHQRSRGSSIGERFPGDMSHRPLDQLRKEAKMANRSPHLKRKHIPGADSIDSLDDSIVGGKYHHGGPYDATLLARNTNYQTSPVAALEDSNAEAIRATPKEYLRDSLDKHVPLQGTSIIPPGATSWDGRVMDYQEGADLMREPDAPGGAYKRWDGVKYLPGDLKGKGEPSYTVEKALKEHKHSQKALNEQNPKSHRHAMSDGHDLYEMQPRQRKRGASGSSANLAPPSNNNRSHSANEADMRRSNTTGRRVGESLRKRLESLKKKVSEV
ncbi:Uncharacterized protein BP5553_08543 [Venustampulla echinocandica]|uniref:Pal1 cell morphology n=1 Tax=Venustampulla echinocandica TaxID=2656787 RepID=A0A370TEI8_9HELO|nr:Uncharacterized protein BP5553_08543 [Venustampulla echinocandica]RDL33104.1 Uncharacterized protein BP5553_08543 [Venustampulla echinocandica]